MGLFFKIALLTVHTLLPSVLQCLELISKKKKKKSSTADMITLHEFFSPPMYIQGPFNKFPDFFVQAFKIVVHYWKFSMLLLYILSNDWPTFMISRSNEQLQLQLEYTLLRLDCHSWWISKMQYGREDTLEERYAIKLF